MFLHCRVRFHFVDIQVSVTTISITVLCSRQSLMGHFFLQGHAVTVVVGAAREFIRSDSSDSIC